MQESTAEAASGAVAVATKVTVTGGVTSFAALLTQVDWLALVGIIIALSGFYFSYQKNKREKELHALQMKQLEGKCNVKD